MPSRTSRPALRPVESIVVPDPRHGRVLVLRDTQGVTSAHAAIPPALVPIVARFDGARTCEEIARDASREIGEEILVDLVVQLADGARSRPVPRRGALPRGARREIAPRLRRRTGAPRVARRRRVPRRSRGAPRVPRRRLPRRGALERRGEASGRRPAASRSSPRTSTRGAAPSDYGHAYDALARALAAPQTSNVRPPRHVARADAAAVRALRQGVRDAARRARGRRRVHREARRGRAGFDAYEDQLNHKREHSLEFQAVFLKHLLGERAARIVPILAGLGAHQARRRDPATTTPSRASWTRCARLVESRRTPSSWPARTSRTSARASATRRRRSRGARRARRHDRASLGRAVAVDARGFWEHVAADLEHASRLRPRPDLVAPPRPPGRREGRAPSLRADGRRGRRERREPRVGRVFRIAAREIRGAARFAAAATR